MDDTTHTPQLAPSKSPTELLNLQTQSLSDLVVAQKQQKDQLAELQHQNETLIWLISNITKVKIEDINMPFGHLVGFMIKASLAAIPATIILFIIYAIIGAIFGGIFGGIFAGLF